mmetsp:Transcript_2806/g.7779  ORF Transcript_2806/g.7779 Transcript_2806/m.7779 type:complete len:361 (-) Transcript_2806:710-1792(-)
MSITQTEAITAATAAMATAATSAPATLTHDRGPRTMTGLEGIRRFGVPPTRAWSHPSNTCVTCRLDLLPTDSMDIILSFLCQPDHAAIETISANLYHTVSVSSTLRMTTQLVVGEIDGLLRRHRQLNTLHLQGAARAGDEIVDKINKAPCSNMLEDLSLGGSTLSYWCLTSLCLPNLHTLELKGGSIRMSIADLIRDSCGSLRRLRIRQSSALRDGTIHDISSISRPKLEELCIKHCARLCTPTIRFDELRRLALVGGFGLVRFPEFQCPKLQCLDLSFCVKLSSKALAQVLLTVPELETLKLVKCSSLQSLDLHGSKVRHVDLTCCDGLKEAHIASESMRSIIVSIFKLNQAGRMCYYM